MNLFDNVGLTWLFFGVLSLLPILIWLFLFRKNLPKNKNYIVMTFIAGMLSVVPIKLYEKYWDTGLLYLEHTNLFVHLGKLLSANSGAALLSYLVATVVVVFGLFVFVALMMMGLELMSGDNSFRVYRRKLKSVLETPFFFVLVGAMCGLVAFAGTLTLNEKVWLFMVVGILEELTKHLVLRFGDEEKIHSVGEAIQFSIVVALGFAFVENLQYFSNISQMSLFSWPQFMMLVGLRSLVSVGAHVSFSAILGYYYGVAKFANTIYQQEVLENRHPLIEKLHNILHLKGSLVFHEQKMMEGVMLAMILHGIYNSLLEFGYVSFALPMVGCMVFAVVALLHQKKLLQKNGVLVKRRFSNESLTEAPSIQSLPLA
jgi:RsiW-degrading membrane proteinase PrsW (M82 family)